MSESITPNGAANEVADLTKAFEKGGARKAGLAGEAGAGAEATLNQFKASLSDLVAKAQAELETRTKALIVKAKEQSVTLRGVAGERAEQAKELVQERPYVAVGAAVLAGFLLGHLISAGRPQVVYLRDKRHLD